jgi:hypothetical protein
MAGAIVTLPVWTAPLYSNVDVLPSPFRSPYANAENVAVGRRGEAAV